MSGWNRDLPSVDLAALLEERDVQFFISTGTDRRVRREPPSSWKPNRATEMYS